jgi:hypothetical protein
MEWICSDADINDLASLKSAQDTFPPFNAFFVFHQQVSIFMFDTMDWV